MKGTITKDGASIPYVANFVRLEKSGNTFKSTIAIIDLDIAGEALEIEVKWDDFECCYSLESDGNKSLAQIREITERYFNLSELQIESLSDKLCLYAENMIYEHY